MAEQCGTPADHGQEPDTGPGEATGHQPEVETGLNDLRSRLSELQQSVELLGSQGLWSEEGRQPQATPPPAASGYPPVDPAGPGGAGPHDPHNPYPPYPDERPPPPPWAQAPFAPGPRPAPSPVVDWQQAPAADYGGAFAADPTSPRPAPWEQPFEAPLTYPAPPVATNGHTTDPAEISARSTTVAIVNAGPFADLIQLRHFEDDLALLAAVRDVRARRFGQGRANIEVAMSGPYMLARELYRLGRPMEISDGPTGEIVVDLGPLPQESPEEADAGPLPGSPQGER